MPRGGLQTSLVSMVNMMTAPFRRQTTGPRRGASAGRGAPICRAPVGAHLSRGPPRLQNTRYAQRRQIERHRLSDLIRRAAPRSGMADRAWQPVETKYFIIVNKFGNGLSSSPSNTPPFDRGRYPLFTTTDNVRVQQRLLAEVFGIERVALVYGFSMGAQQAFHWAALFPDRVEQDRADLRFGQDLGPQFRFSRRRQGGADRRSGLAGRRVRHSADARLPGDGPGLCRLGAEPGVLSREDLAQDRLLLAGGLPDRQLGGQFSPPRR